MNSIVNPKQHSEIQNSKTEHAACMMQGNQLQDAHGCCRMPMAAHLAANRNEQAEMCVSVGGHSADM